MVARQAETQHRTHPAAAALSARRADRGTAAAVLALQRSAGNRAVCSLLRCGDKKKKRGGGAGSAEQKAVKAAPNQSQYQFNQLLPAVQDAITDILNGTEGPYLRPNRGFHATDPETGMPKVARDNVGVREYHVAAHDESKRIVVRTQGQDKRVYYDPSHAGGTYTYHRVNGAPFPAPAAAVPAAVPVAVAPVVPAPAPAPVPAVVPAATVVPNSWDE